MQSLVLPLANPFTRAMDVRVIKLGGSLLELPELRRRFDAWFAAQPPAVNLMIVGGGELVEAVRRVDQQHSLDAALVHWVCIDLMGTTAEIAAGILGNDRLIGTRQELEGFLRRSGSEELDSHPSVAILQPSAYINRQEVAQDGCELPEDWSCTSDSIAAWLAMKVNASELVLLKSTSVDGRSLHAVSGDQLDSLSQQGLFDAAFPRFARDLASVRVVNLREVSFG